jgi:hypothetical protein
MDDATLLGGIVRIEVPRSGAAASRGTGFIVRIQRAESGTDVIEVLTALHVIADVKTSRQTGKPVWWGATANLQSRAGATAVAFSDAILHHSIAEDWALLRFEVRPPHTLTALSLTVLDDRTGHRHWRAFGYTAVSPVKGEPLTGHVTLAEPGLIHLYCDQAAAGSGGQVSGCSGAPCVVEGHVVGLIGEALQKDRLSIHGAMYAYPIAAIAEACGLPLAGAELPPRPTAVPPRILRTWRSIVRGRSLPDGFSSRPGEGLRERETLELAPVRCLALLGEAGMGKSTELKALHAASTGPSLLCGLGPYRSGAAILDFLERQDRWQKWRTDQGPLELFLDGLDECLLTVPEVVQFLIDTFTNFGTRGLSLRIACRTGAWSPRLAESLHAWYGPHFEVVELLSLTSEGASLLAGQLLNDEGTALRFQHELRRPEIELLAARPVTLRMLIKLFAREKLPNSRIDLYRRGLRMLLSEWDVEKARRRAPFLEDPLPLASWIAAAFALGNRTALAERRRDDLPDDTACITVSELVTHDWDRHLVEATVLSAAFLDTDISDEQGWLRAFAHRTFAEFLAAQWLYDRRLPPVRILALIGDARRVAPQMEEVASWLAALDSAWFSALLGIQPEIVVRGDPAALSPDRRREALAAILAACATEALQDNTTGWEHELWRLDYPGIEDDLAAAIRAEIPVGRSLFVSRRVAIATAKDLCPALAARDPARAAKLLDALATTAALPDTRTEGSNVRSAAGWALYELAAEGGITDTLIVPAVQRLRPSLALADVSDRGEFRGLALMLLFPRWMDEAELVEHLPSLPRLSYSGNYAMLLGHHLPPLIANSSSLAALLGHWLARRIRTSKDLGRYDIPDTFIGAIIDTCVSAYPNPAPVDAVAELLFTASFHGVLPKISPNLLSDPERRRGLLRGVLQRWTMRRWSLLASRLQHYDPDAAAGNTDARSGLLPRLAELAALTGRDVAPVKLIREQCSTWAIPMLRDAFRQTRSPDHRTLERENPITWHLTPQLSHSDDFLYWARQAAHEDDPLLREEFTNTARKLLNPDPEESNQSIAELRAIVALTTDTIRESLEADFQDLLDDQRLSDLRAERCKHRPRQGPEDGKTPQARLVELLEAGHADPKNVFPTILMALPLRPTDTRWGEPYSGDLTEFAAWKESPPAMRQELRTLARAFLIQENPQEDTWVGKPEFPSTLLDACRAFQLLALDPAEPPDLGLPAEVWRTWARTLLDKLDSVQPRLDGILRELARQAPDAAARFLELLETAHRQSNEHDQSRLVRTALVVRTPPVMQALIQHAQAADLPLWPDRNILVTLVLRRLVAPQLHNAQRRLGVE